MRSHTTGEISKLVGGHLQGPGDIVISGVNVLHEAKSGELTFIGDLKHARDWPQSSASAALVSAEFALTHDDPDKALVQVPQADLAMAQVLELFAPASPTVPAGIHPTATVDASAKLADDTAVGPHCLIGPGVEIGAGTVLHGQVTILDGTRVGASCFLWPGVVIRERCRIGDHCMLHPNAVIGADGFGYRPAPDNNGLVKIPQIGSVVIGDDVEIGAGTCIDRGKFAATTVGRGSKIDNLCQIAHGCQIGKNCIIAGLCGIAGSVTIGDGTVLGGKVGVKDHVRIGENVQVAGGASVLSNVPAGQTWGGTPAKDLRTSFREMGAVRRLPNLLKTLRSIAPRGTAASKSTASAR